MGEGGGGTVGEGGGGAVGKGKEGRWGRGRRGGGGGKRRIRGLFFPLSHFSVLNLIKVPYP